jgi:signal transduction histidine kinase/CheY-like chemotaxis protein
MTAPPLLDVTLDGEAAIAECRQRARQAAALCGFDVQGQTRIATAVSEIARNAVAYGGGGKARFTLEEVAGRQALVVLIADDGPGMDRDAVLEGRRRTGLGAGISGTRRLMDFFSLDTAPGAGARVRFGKFLPRGRRLDGTQAATAQLQLVRTAPQGAPEELRAQQRALMESLAELEARQEDLARINTELEDTNRGVVALHAELEDRAAELRQASELKSRFLSNMTHEFRTPLNSILALSRLLLDRTDGPLAPEQERQVTYIRRSAENLTELVDDLLDLAKVEAGKIEMRPRDFTVSELFGGLRGVLKPLQASAAVELLFDDTHGGTMLRSDEGKVAQILRNLVSNALKFTEAGEVRVSFAPPDPADPEVPGLCRLMVTDTGIGIAAEDQERIFQEFAQVPGRLQARQRGTGLGLSLSRRLAELLGGRLTVSSRPGHGSAFTLAIPLVLPGLGPREEPARPPPAPGTRSVLVVDDEEAFRYVMRQMLAAMPNLVVEEAASGPDGLARAAGHPTGQRPDLILLDLRMPQPDGFEVLRRLRQDPATAAIPVVVCTSSVLDSGDRERLSGAAAVLSKAQLSRPGLVAAIAPLLGQGQAAMQREG